MEYPSKVPSSMAHGLHRLQERDFINLDPLQLIPSTPCLQPAMKTPTMSKKLSIFDDERNKILQSLSDIRLSVSEMPLPTTNERTENLLDLGDDNRNRSRMQSLSGSVDQFTNMNLLLEQSFPSEESQGNREVRNLPLSEKLKHLSLEVGQYMTDCFPAGNKLNFIDNLAQTFYVYSLHDLHRVIGESAIAGILKFFVGIPLDCSVPVTLKQEKQIYQLRSALFKECGFSLEVSIIPVMCFRHKRSIFHFSFSDPACLPFRLITLLKVKNKKGKDIILDSNSRVYSDIEDWRKHNTLSPSTVYVSLVNPPNREENNSSSPYTIRKLQTPSCQASKMAFDMMDIAVGVGAVGGGIACLLTGGLALPVLLAGELAASVYMGFRGSMSLLDKRRHKPKSRR